MRPIASNDRVRLTASFDELDLHKGDVGRVTSSWYYPTPAYEVEFHVAGCPLRLLLLNEQVCPELALT